MASLRVPRLRCHDSNTVHCASILDSIVFLATFGTFLLSRKPIGLTFTSWDSTDFIVSTIFLLCFIGQVTTRNSKEQDFKAPVTFPRNFLKDCSSLNRRTLTVMHK